MKGTIVKTIAAVICGVALLTLVSIAAASAASQRTASSRHHRVTQGVAHPAYVLGHTVAKNGTPLPFLFDVTALGGVGGCLLVLGAWGFWQTKRRCTTCGYCPAFCGCDELAHH